MNTPKLCLITRILCYLSVLVIPLSMCPKSMFAQASAADQKLIAESAQGIPGNGAPSSHANNNGNANASTTNAELLNELTAMRDQVKLMNARIEQLEAQIKAQSAA